MNQRQNMIQIIWDVVQIRIARCVVKCMGQTSNTNNFGVELALHSSKNIQLTTPINIPEIQRCIVGRKTRYLSTNVPFCPSVFEHIEDNFGGFTWQLVEFNLVLTPSNVKKYRSKTGNIFKSLWLLASVEIVMYDTFSNSFLICSRIIGSKTPVTIDVAFVAEQEKFFSPCTSRMIFDVHFIELNDWLCLIIW